MAQGEIPNGELSVKHFSDKTAFGTIHKFDEIKDDRLINTESFLQACTDLVSTEGRIGATFAAPKKDMMGNIKKIHDRYKTNPKLYVTLNAIFEEDSQAKKKPTHTVTACIWLKRALEFSRAFISGLSADFHSNVQDENLRHSLLKAYEDTLKQHHGPVAQLLFSSIARLMPYRKDVLKAWMLHEDTTVAMLFSDIDLYLITFSACVDALDELLNYYGLNAQEKAK